MPEEGLPWSTKDQILSYEEMLRLVRILADLGISKVRITGGEPLIQQEALISWLEVLNNYWQESMKCKELIPIEVETNGTILPLENLDRIVCSHPFRGFDYEFDVDSALRSKSKDKINLPVEKLKFYKENFVRLVRNESPLN